MEKQNRPSLKEIIGFANKVRFFLGKNPEYTTEMKNEIASRGVSQVDGLGLYSWQTVYDSYIAAGLTPEAAKKETDARVWTID